MSRSKAKAGRPHNGPPEGQPWIWLSREMLTCVTFQALGVNARRVLDFLMMEHMSHGGTENGNLGASYRQLATRGVAPTEVRQALAELMTTGFIRCTVEGFASAGGRDPSRFALTWLPTGKVGTPEAEHPTNDWRAVHNNLFAQEVRNVAGAKRWLKGKVPARSQRLPSRTKTDSDAANASGLTRHLQVVGA